MWNLLGVFSVLLKSGGSALEFEEISAVYAAYGGELWRALLVVAGGRGDLAREATAEAFARLVANVGSVSEPRGWLYRTGYRVVIDELRREQRRVGRCQRWREWIGRGACCRRNWWRRCVC